MFHLTREEWARVEYLMPDVERLIHRMAVDGVTHPIAAMRAALDDHDAATAPILAAARGVSPEALRWAPDLRILLVIHDHRNGVRLRAVIHACLDQIALGRMSETRGEPTLPAG